MLLHKCVYSALEHDANAECDGVAEEPCSILVAFEVVVTLQCEEIGRSGMHGADLNEDVFAGVRLKP
jgi:hypothetical protein